jgi:hypothetical protein
VAARAAFDNSFDNNAGLNACRFARPNPFDDVTGTTLTQNAGGSFYGVVSRDVGTENPNPVCKVYQDLP